MPEKRINCPKHGVCMDVVNTSYGKLHKCMVNGCTFTSWAHSDSTPADEKTRYMRKVAHSAFDPLWGRTHNKAKIREDLYKELSEYMDISLEQCHIDYFDAHQCVKVVDFAFAKKCNDL